MDGLEDEAVKKALVSAKKMVEAASKGAIKPVMTPDVVYSANMSMTGRTESNLAFPLSYGSADLEGFKFIDTVCLNPLDYQSLDDINPDVLKANFCVQNFKY